MKKKQSATITPKVIVAQMGARRHYAVPRMLHDAEMLEHLYTDICAVKGWPRILGLIPAEMLPSCLRRLRSRRPLDLPSSKITAFSNLGFSYALARSTPRDMDDAIRIRLHYAKKFCSILATLKYPERSIFYTFNFVGLELMTEAQKRGMRVVMDQTIAPKQVENDILNDACIKYPDWRIQLADGQNTREFIKREATEWRFADLILCGSEFVKQGVGKAGGPIDKCVVVPYGVDSSFSMPLRDIRQHEGPLRVLTVGAVGLRKGTPDIVEAARLLEDTCRFRLVGPLQFPTKVIGDIPSNITMTGVVPRADMIEHYVWADVFLLPSLCEGSAIAIYEALNCGLPVICTDNSGSIIEDGIDGFIVPILSPEKIVDRLSKLAKNRKLLSTFSKAAQNKATLGTTTSYQKRICRVLQEFNNGLL